MGQRRADRSGLAWAKRLLMMARPWALVIAPTPRFAGSSEHRHGSHARVGVQSSFEGFLMQRRCPWTSRVPACLPAPPWPPRPRVPTGPTGHLSLQRHISRCGAAQQVSAAKTIEVPVGDPVIPVISNMLPAQLHGPLDHMHRCKLCQPRP